MKNLDCNQIKIFINLEIIGEKKLYLFFLKIFFIFGNLVKPLGTTTVSKSNFYYIVLVLCLCGARLNKKYFDNIIKFNNK